MTLSSEVRDGKRGGEKYREAMARLEVTPEARERVARSAAEAAASDSAAERPHRKTSLPTWLPLAACLLLVAVVGAWALRVGREEPPANDALVTGPVEVESLAELSEAVGFDVDEPSTAALPFEPASTIYTSYGDVAEIAWTGSDGECAYWRESQGSGDNSGDYTDYADVVTLANGATLKGENGVYTLAIWEQNGMSYSLALAPGLDADAWEALLSAL